MARLIGRQDLVIDEKGRLVLPSVHRERFAGGAVVFNRRTHLGIYEPAEWERTSRRLIAAREAGEFSREEFNAIAAQAVDQKVDASGRIHLPAYLRTQVGLEREVTVTGAQEYLAVYPAGYLDGPAAEVGASAAEKMDRLGI